MRGDIGGRVTAAGNEVMAGSGRWAVGQLMGGYGCGVRARLAWVDVV